MVPPGTWKSMSWLAEELAALGDLPNLKPAARLLHELVTADEFEEFLTLPAYELLDQSQAN
jgi:hypothetical protein